MICVTIPMKTPSLNEYIKACNKHWSKGNDLKQDIQAEMCWYLKKLPKLPEPVFIKFIWVSKKDDRRDLDNICFGKKFILDALQTCGKLTNDSRKYVVGFTDEFIYGSQYEVRLEIENAKEGEYERKEDTSTIQRKAPKSR